MISDPIKKFIDTVAELPSIGPRQAARLAFYLINSGEEEINSLSEVISGLNGVKKCSECFFIHQTEGDLCYICSNPQRRGDIIAIVEKETDLISLEKAKSFNGRYLILGDLKKAGTLSTSQKNRLSDLKNRINENYGGQAEEIIVAISPTTYGDLNSSVIAKELNGLAKKITRLARGIPTGGEIEFADEETLSEALKRRN